MVFYRCKNNHKRCNEIASICFINDKILTIRITYRQLTYFCVMKISQLFYNIMVKGSVLVGISVASLTYVVTERFQFPLDYNLLLFMFFGTVFGYNFIKYLDEFKQHRGHVSSKGLQVILLLTVIACILSGFLFVSFSEKMKEAIVLPLLVIVFYTLPWAFKKLRNIKGAKIYIIALTWAYVIGYLPIVFYNASITKDVILTLVQLFLLVFALMIPFEVRDLKLDDPSLHTLPQRFGVKQSRRIGMVAMIVFLMIQFFYAEVTMVSIIIASVVTKITLLALWFTRKEMAEQYASVFVESIPIVWAVLIYLF